MPITTQSTYNIVKELGRGRMAIAYLAQNRNNGRYCVLKVFYTLSNGDSALNLVNREAQIQRRLDHSGIVRVSGVVQDVIVPNNPGRHHALIMEYVAGQDLGTYLHRKRKLAVEETVRIAIQICRSLAYAHQKGIIHHDIKPQNILIRNDGVVKLTDFGFASATSESIMSLSSVVGTPYYISPEQAMGAKGDQQSDIYAVGVMMYEMLCGTVPFQGSHPSVVIDQHRTAIPQRLSERIPAIPTELDDFVLKALEKRPNDRFHSAGEMVTVLERIADELGIQLHTLSWKAKATLFWHKTVDNLVANLTGWIFSAALAFASAVFVATPTTVEEAIRLIVQIVVPTASPTSVAPGHGVGLSFATQTPMPIATPTSTPPPSPTATGTPMPPHVICTSDDCLPEPGYSWVNKDDEADMRVVWESGVAHPDFPHVSAADKEGYWNADPGYDFVEPNNSLSVVWKPGVYHPDFPNITASDRESYWNSDPGYDFIDPNNSLRVVWKPGMQHPEHLYVIAGDEEGNWRPAPGYTWQHPDATSNFDVVWKSGAQHPDNSSSFAAKQEGQWVVGTINAVTVDHNVVQNDMNGMLIHINFSIDNLPDEKIWVAAYFHYKNGTILQDKNDQYNTVDGQVSVGDEVNVPYQGTQYEDYQLFIPYSEMDLGNCSCELKFQIVLQANVGTLARSEDVGFQYNGG